MSTRYTRKYEVLIGGFVVAVGDDKKGLEDYFKARYNNFTIRERKEKKDEKE